MEHFDLANHALEGQHAANLRVIAEMQAELVEQECATHTFSTCRPYIILQRQQCTFIHELRVPY
jgi:hypothetical protein